MSRPHFRGAWLIARAGPPTAYFHSHGKPKPGRHEDEMALWVPDPAQAQRFVSLDDVRAAILRVRRHLNPGLCDKVRAIRA